MGSICATFATLCPQGMFCAGAHICADLHLIDKPAPFDGSGIWFVRITLCLLPWITYEAWRAARAISLLGNVTEETLPNVHPLLEGSLYAVLLTAGWLPYVVATYGPWAQIVAYCAWPIVTLSYLAFVLAAAQVDAESRGEKVRPWLVTSLHNVRGVFGVVFARRMFPGSKVCQQFPCGIPTTLAPLVLIVVSFLASPYIVQMAVRNSLLTGSGSSPSRSEGELLAPLDGFTGAARPIESHRRPFEPSYTSSWQEDLAEVNRRLNRDNR
jgi:hypothetical protein